MLQLDLHWPRGSVTIDVSLQIGTGETYCLFGPSAAGKSSILNAIAGFGMTSGRQLSGRLSLQGAILFDTDARPPLFTPPWRRRFGFVTQAPRLFPHLTVLANILYGAPPGQKETALAFARHFARRFDIASLLDAPPSRLSGGQQQKVALLRALAARPHALLCDEPFSALDWPARRELQETLRTLADAEGWTVLFVTHDLSEAQRLGTRMGLLDAGRLLQEGDPGELTAHPVSERAARLLGYTRVIDIAGMGRTGVRPDRTLIGAYPEHGPVLSGTVVETLSHEGSWHALVRLVDGECLEARHPFSQKPEPGESVCVTLLSPPIW
jgi:ABC-type sulfate/molybdate transport systems ATPase subunit